MVNHVAGPVRVRYVHIILHTGASLDLFQWGGGGGVVEANDQRLPTKLATNYRQN